jgi:RNA polymerase sigma-70 factor (ECF subfamily)
MPSDDELMGRVAGGDLAAFDALVQRHQDAAWRLAHRFLGESLDAQDATQDAFLKLFTRAARYEPRGEFRSYLLTIVSRTCLDWLRKRRPAVPGELPEVLDPNPIASEARETEDRRRAVQAALLALPEKQRMAIVLKYYEAMSYRDIARVLGTSEKAVERLLARGREQLRGQLGDADPGPQR